MNLTNSVLQNFYRKAVAPALARIPLGIRGTVLEYYPEQNRCKVRFRDPNNRNQMEVIVPILLSGGANHSGPFPGEEVLLLFPGGNYTFGVALGVLDLNFSSSTRGRRQDHTRKGPYVPDAIDERIGGL